MFDQIQEFLDCIAWRNPNVDADLEALTKIDEWHTGHIVYVEEIYQALRIERWKAEFRESGTVAYAFYQTGRFREVKAENDD